MLQTINTKILLSAAVILASAAVIVGATFAFFADTETSTANTLAAGELDLRVDSTAHYAGMVCTQVEESYVWVDEDVDEGNNPRTELLGEACEGTWTETDLSAENVFFTLTDIKPGDAGENTISLHVYDNDAWGRMVIDTTEDSDVNCTEPESESSDPECSQDPPIVGDGELRENLAFSVFLDQGAIAGFQNIDAEGNAFDPIQDPTEGDNIQQCVTPGNAGTCDEPTVITEGEISEDATEETFEFRQGLAAVAASEGCDEDGHMDYEVCQGLAADGRMVGSTTYYMGVLWTLPGEVGNEAQTDSFVANVTFDALQHRNNPTPVFPTVTP